MQKAGAFCAWGPDRDAGGAAQRGAGPFEGWYKAPLRGSISDKERLTVCA